jgi:integrase
MGRLKPAHFECPASARELGRRMARNLTEVRLKTIKPPAKGRVVEVDNEVSGLCFRVTATGARSWLIRYRVKGRTGQRYVVPGPYPTVSLADARQRAREIIAAAKRGEDLPEEERRRATIAAATTPDMVANVSEEYIRRSLEGRDRAPSYISATRRIFDQHVLPRWGDRDIRTINRRDVVALLDGVVDDGKPVLANRVLAAVRAMFGWAVRRGVLEASPATLVERPAAEKPRERTLSADEIATLWPHIVALGYPFGPFFQMALATGQRREEVARMRWADIDTDERAWTLSGKQTKARRAHVVPLSPIAWDILMAAQGAARILSMEATGTEAGKDSPYVFTTSGDRPISGFGKAKARVDAAVEKARLKSGLGPLPPWTIHDLRRTMASGLGKLGEARFVISRVLNHADSSVTGIYDRHAYLAQKRHALEKWGNYLGTLILPPGANILRFRSGSASPPHLT